MHKIKNLNKILFIGLGGAGQRHLRNFRLFLPSANFLAFRHKNKTPLLNEDFTIDHSSSIEEKYFLKNMDSIEKAIYENPDLVVICTPTSRHFEFTKLFAKNKISIFVEKPGAINFSQAKTIKKLVNQNQVGYHVGFQRQFHPFLISLKDRIKKNIYGKLINIRANISSFMPLWHKYEDYRDLYASRKDLGGGIINTESHELYFFIDIFGLPKYVTGYQQNRKFYDLNITHSCNIQLHYQEFIIEMNLSFFHKRNERSIVIYGTKGWDFIDLERNIFDSSFDKSDNPLLKKSFLNEELFKKQTQYIIKNYKKINNKILKNILNLSSTLEKVNKLKIY